MNTSLLRKIRIILSIIFVVPTTLVLIDFSGLLPENAVNGIIYFQFVPSLIKSISIFSFITTGFILVFILTILFGRVYCSTICPLGFLQDLVNYISGVIGKKKKRRFVFKKEQRILRWTLFTLPVILFLFGSSFGITLLDPYSMYGRISGNFFRPVLISSNNLAASILESFKIYWIFPFEIHSFNPVPFAITGSFFLLVLYLSYFKGRLYCNTVCPVGTFLGFISRFSFYKIRIEKEDCLKCGICAKDCKANCINSEEMSVDMSRCVACFNCIQSCPTEGIKYQFALPAVQSADSFDQSKRNFLIASGVYLASVSEVLGQVKKKIVAKKESTVPVIRENAISPPGSLSLERFNGICTACHLCVSACPTQVLQPSFLEYGFLGMLQPRLDNTAGFCNFECKICGDVCPTGAILPLSLKDKKLAQLGKAKFIKENCIVETEKTDCGACSEHCPTKAVHMIPYQGKLFIPEVRDEYCIGCGACEYACPTKPYKSIYIEGNPVHQIAKLNQENLIPQKKVDYKEEFPF